MLIKTSSDSRKSGMYAAHRGNDDMMPHNPTSASFPEINEHFIVWISPQGHFAAAFASCQQKRRICQWKY
jgi:hypothetical protein